MLAAVTAIPLQSVLLALALTVLSLWRDFEKASQSGWHATVPLFNGYVTIRLAGKPGWRLVLFLVPGVNLYAAFLVFESLAARFGKRGGFAKGLLLAQLFESLTALGAGSTNALGGAAGAVGSVAAIVALTGTWRWRAAKSARG